MSVRERLINTASILFYQNGYNTTGINEVIEKAKVAKASLYTHFKTKDDLCIAYLQQKEGKSLDELKNAVKGKTKGKLQILAIFDHLRDVYRQDDFKGSPITNILAEISITNEKIKEEAANHRAELKAFIKELVINNVDSQNPEKLANRIYLLYTGAMTQSYIEHDSWPIKEAKEMALTML